LSGIVVTPDLASKFADAVEAKSTRFIKVSIQNESLVHDLSIQVKGSFEDDLQNSLQDDDVLPKDFPAYILAKLDAPSPDWVIVSYVPDNAKVRDKMLYASTRVSLLKSLGSTLFRDSIFATSKADLTPKAYNAHLLHNSAPIPLSAREQEIADLREAENEAASYAGSQVRTSHVGTGVGLNWSPEVEHAVTQLGEGMGCSIVIINIDPSTETLILGSTSDISIDALGSALPQSEPCYCLVAWPHPSPSSDDTNRNLVFIYSCPSSSPIKHRMLYSSGSTTTFQAVKNILDSSTFLISVQSRKIETSDPQELNEAFLITELGLDSNKKPSIAVNKAFARPKGPPRRR
jgi:twinfilin-like protein